MKTRVSSRILIILALALVLTAFAILPVAAEGGILPDTGILPNLPDVPDLPSEEELEGVRATVQSFFTLRGLEDLRAILEGETVLFLLLLAAASLVMALWGYNLSRTVFITGGFVGGCMLGAAIYDPIVGTGIFGTDLPSYVRYIFYVIFGVIAALLVLRILRAGIFLAAAVSAYFFLCSFPPFELLVDAVYQQESDYKYLIARLLIAAGIGGLALALTRPVIIVMTSAAGGMLAAVCLSIVVGLGSYTVVITILGIVFIVLGLVSQFRVRKKRG